MANILVIDDDPASCFLVKSLLEKVGYRVFVAGGGDEGLRLFAKHPIDVVITDILMPGTDGLAVIRELLTRAPDVKIIALSGGGMILTAEISVHVARKMGAFASLLKPVDRVELLATLQRVLQPAAAEGEVASQTKMI
ncbi:MAG: response regulator [Magnetococcales bacterium]|nr:response regulator [Magnetococcales bacterium]